MEHRLRSLLFVPGNQAKMLAKAENVAVDVVVPDLEDSVPDAEKANARSITASFLPKLAANGRLVVPRVNSLSSPWLEDDLESIVGAASAATSTRVACYGISVGKIGAAGDIAEVSNRLATLEHHAGLPVGHFKLIPWIETAKAIVRCYEICTASERIVAIAFGAEDFTNDLGVERSDDDSQLLYARSALCVAARAAGVVALETPHFKLHDPQGLRASSLAAKRLGFKGRFAIHPEQVEAINACFAPSADEIEHARRVVAAYEEAEKQGRASTSLDGRVIDVPVVKRARALLELWERL
jgi:citrate lyase subunit beta/citryl-CoA lyase